MWIIKDLTKNFFDINQEVALISPFKELIESVGKRRASNIMWSIYLVYHPDSIYYLKYGEDEVARQKAVNKEFNNRESVVNFVEYKNIITAFDELIPPSIKSLAKWETELKSFDRYTDGLTFESNFKQKMEALKEKPNVWKMFMEAKKEYESDSREATANRGNYQGSFLEKGMLN